MRYALAAIWLLAVAVLQGFPLGRRVASYGGSVILMVHLCALIAGLWLQKSSRDGVPTLTGFAIGTGCGLLLGLLGGELVYRQPALFWLVQTGALLFLALLPLFPAR